MESKLLKFKDVMHSSRAMRVAILGCVVVLAVPQWGWAQSALNSGQIAGLVLDPSGAAVPGVDVSVRNVGTNYARTTPTDAVGRYVLVALPVGTYEVTVLPVNMEVSSQEVYVSLGGRVAANFTLGIPPVRTSVDIVASSPTRIEPSQTYSKSVLTDIQLRNLPTSGRRARNMFLLTPATQIEPECGGFSIAGQKGLYTNLNVDGGDYTSTHWCGDLDVSPTISMEAVEEFQVLRSTFSAEFGRSTGGTINLATKSGTNQFHGTAFYLFRNDATTTLDPLGREQLGLGQQFGGTFGGPIIADRMFFFSTVEFQNNSKDMQVLYTNLDQQGLRGAPGALELLRVAPEAQLAAMGKTQQTVNRGDYHLNTNNTLMGRLDYTRNRVTDSVGTFIVSQGLGANSVTNRSVQNAAPINSRDNVTGMVQLTSVTSARTVNEVRVQLVREYRPWTVGTGPEVTVRNRGQTIAIYGPQATGLAYGNVGYEFTDVRQQIIDNFSIVTGAHTVKMGFDYNRLDGQTTFSPGENGIYRFETLDNYLNRRPSRYQQFAGTGTLDATLHQFAVYIQDEWRIRRGFTISPGFRYEMARHPDYVAPTVPENRFPLATTIPDDNGLLAPRLGMAWDVFNNATTVFRAAGGLFYAPPYLPLFEQSMLSNGGNPELSSSVVLNGTRNIERGFQEFGIGLANAPLDGLPTFTTAEVNQLASPASRSAGQRVFFFDPDFRLPRAVHLRAAIEQEIASGIVAVFDYTHINTTRMDRVRNINLPVPVVRASGRPVYLNVATTKPYPRFGEVYVTESSARALYRAFNASVNMRRAPFIWDASYTLSWNYSHDDHERGNFSAANYDSAHDLNNEYGYSILDQRHQFMSNGMVFLPFGIDLAGTVRFNSGRPLDARTGADLNGDGRANRDRPVQGGRVVRRNTFRNLGYSDVSMRVQKNFVLPNERGRFTVSAELFNVFDFDNVEVGESHWIYGPSLDAPPMNPNFGKVKDADGNYLTNSTLRSSPFQVQLGLRFQF